jgi:glycosyltransferase involved in cell wall biosynthesis
VREVGGDVAVYAEPGGLADAIRQALAQRERLVAAGLERARLFSWEETARRTLDVYREALGSGLALQHPKEEREADASMQDLTP